MVGKRVLFNDWPTSIWPSVVKGKSSPIDRKERRAIRPKVNEALTNDPVVPACVFRRECQYAKGVCTKHL